MPREVICIHIGQCGIQTGNQIWELFCMEHGIMPDGSNPNDKTPGEENDPYNAYFAELSSGKCVPRAIWLDLDPSTLDDIKKSAYKEMYHPATLIAGKEDAANNGCLGAGRTGRNATREGGGEKGAQPRDAALAQRPESHRARCRCAVYRWKVLGATPTRGPAHAAASMPGCLEQSLAFVLNYERKRICGCARNV